MEAQQITSHGQDEMIFHCDRCGNDVATDTSDSLIAEDSLHCSVYGTRNDQLDLPKDR